MTGPTYYRIAQLASTRNSPGIVPLAKTTIWRKVGEGTFPPPVKVSANVTAWRSEDIAKWVENPAATWCANDDGKVEGKAA